MLLQGAQMGAGGWALPLPPHFNHGSPWNWVSVLRRGQKKLELWVYRSDGRKS